MKKLLNKDKVATSVSDKQSNGSSGKTIPNTVGKFGLVQPSLIQQLRSILDQYQDDGQILKELIQNAEDAKASQVKFLLDETDYDRRSKYLHHPELAEFQGPALYAYNNAEFTDTDWAGLKMINDSVKKDDALKIGRFGLGFKSVFHMTDLPSILSGQKLCFIDPHEKFFVEEGRKVTGYTWHLKDDSKVIKKLTSQFEPYKGIFGCSDATFKQSHFPGSLFRFPLRNKESQLSNNLYSTEKVLQIFESFQTIAELVLLFLTSVESIELYRRRHGQTLPDLLFKIQITPQSLPSVRISRHSFTQKLSGGSCTVDAREVFPVTMETLTSSDGLRFERSSRDFLVSHFCAGTNNQSEDMSLLLSDSSMKFVPWASAAISLDSTALSAKHPKGHVFCFLPLPLQRSSMSGLPVHINAYFAVSSNRHQLKWPSIKYTQSQGESVGSTDKSCQWNEVLLEEVVPKAMFNLISEVIDMARRSKMEIKTEFIYNMIPDPALVLDRWKLVLPLFFKKLGQIEFIQSDSNKSWQKYQKVILLSHDDEDSETQRVLLRSLILAGVNAVLLPSHLSTVLRSYLSAEDMFATPELMRLVFKKKSDILSALSAEDKLVLLEYLLSDSKYDDMIGLPLVPLVNGRFAEFSEAGTEELSNYLFLPSEAHPSSLLPMMSGSFIDTSNRISDMVIKHLKVIASKEKHRIKIFSASLFAKLLPVHLAENMLIKDAYYAEVLCQYIGNNFSDACQFEGLPLIVATNNSHRQQVLSLSSDKPVITICHTDGSPKLSPLLTSCLEKLAVQLVYSVPSYLLTSQKFLEKYVFLPTAKGVMSILRVYSSSRCLGSLSNLSARERVAVREVLSKLLTSDVTDDDLVFLRSLALFQVAESVDYISAEEGKVAAPTDCPPLPGTLRLLDVREASSKALSELLGVPQLSKSSLLVNHIIPAIEGGLCAAVDISQTMVSILHDITPYHDENAIDQLKSLKFVLREDNSVVEASQCYDPTESTLTSLLIGENLFPSPQYSSGAAIESLRLLGLKGASDIDCDLIKQIAQKIEEMTLHATSSKKVIRDKSMGLLEYLNTHPQLIEKDKDLGLFLTDCSWAVPISTRTPDIPGSLNYFSSGLSTVSPRNITSLSNSSLIASVQAVLPIDLDPRLLAVFEWDCRPPLTLIVRNLNNIVQCYRASDKGSYMNMLADIYKVMLRSNFSELKNCLNEAQLLNWVWNGDGFVPANRILVEKSSTNLSPYIYCLPQEMSEYRDLLLHFGAWTVCTNSALLEVLQLIRDKYNQTELFDKDEVAGDLRLVLDIISELKPAPGEKISEELREMILLPVLTDSEHRLALSPVSECTFCDTDWLKERRSQVDHTETIRFIHPAISIELAEQLGVPSLVNRMLDTDNFELGEGFGQAEPLTRRLHNLLKEYSDGFSVPKELLQNADDAGATEVRFLYDERTNKDCLSCLIDDGMKECQGPALWVYNNATFSDADFEAIIKLSGATKSNQTEKIGGFGLGFNSVYNLTDVPSFLSRNYVVIFDPHTTHLGKSIPDPNKPGIKMDLLKNHKALATLRNQFKPYTGVFGADLRHRGQGVMYDGTLFRFPLRNSKQAKQSEISSLHYDKEQMKSLLEMLARSCDSLLLFTQNVRKITVYHLPEHLQPHQASLLFSVTKEPVKYLRELRVPINLPPSVTGLTEDEQEFTRQSSILKAASSILKEQRDRRNSRNIMTRRFARGSSEDSRVHYPESSILLKVRYMQTREGCQLLGLSEGPQDTSTHWLVTATLGDGDAVEAALKYNGFSPVGSVAVALDLIGGELHSRALRNSKSEGYSGKVFCYLPLPITSGLPVHINGAFAVTSNRRYLVEKVSDNKTNDLVEWNHALMTDSIAKSYILMLEDIKALVDPKSYSFYLLWPRVGVTSASCRLLVQQFYKNLSSPLIEQKLFSSGSTWVTLASTVLLDSEITSSNISKSAFSLVQLVMSNTSNIVLELPSDILHCFSKCGCDESIKERTLTRQMLFQKIVFPNLSKIPEDIRDEMVLSAIDSTSSEVLQNLVRTHQCIPVTPDGRKLSFVQDLINPSSQLAVLYSEEDGRFPFGERSDFLSSKRLMMLETLGMTSVDLPDTEVLERAQSIAALNVTNKKEAKLRTTALLQYMETRLLTSPDTLNDIQEKMRRTPFLPVMRRPDGSTLEWTGERQASELLHPCALYPSELSGLLCYVEPLLDSKRLGIPISDRLLLYLGIKKPVTPEQALAQLAFIQENEKEAMKSYPLTKKICLDLYEYMQASKLSPKVLSSLGRFVLIGNSLVLAENVVLKGARDCSPYLFELPYELNKFEHLFRQAGMRDRFEVDDFVQALNRMRQDYSDSKISNSDLQTVLNIATLLHHSLSKKNMQVAEVISEDSAIYLPNISCRLVNAATLCFNDCNWLPDDGSMEFAHDLIPYQIARSLGVNTKRQEAIKKHSHGIPFGQKEKLTKRLKRIMSSYPCGKEIFKELLQNADDAGATQVHFVKDCRHHPTVKIFEECWKPLQGPALCVYNNRPFSKSDMEGIQNLGEGSKGHDPNRTGQYGVGFNSVYHLTDSPSFLTHGEEVGEVLCAFDPHCKFVPGATAEEPGRMFADLSDMKGVFADVFNCYLTDQFNLENSTMFRFPLRNKEMATHSKISNVPVSLDTISELMKKFKQEMFDVLLFVNNVEEITLSDIPRTNSSLNTSYSVKCKVTQRYSKLRKEFSSYIKDIGTKLKNKELSVADVPVKEVAYKMTLEDSEGLKETWLIVQRVGFEYPQLVPHSIRIAHSSGELSLLPRGGVACLINRQTPKNSKSNERPCKVFCFLPLPIHTKLPVHINGHFALDHEARRGLWRDDDGGCRTDWNNTLISQVICPAYKKLLESCKEKSFPSLDGQTSHVKLENADALLDVYHKLFPEAQQDEQWQLLVNGLYRTIAASDTRLFPVFNKDVWEPPGILAESSDFLSSVENGEKSTNSFAEIKWYPLLGQSDDIAFFMDQSVSEKDLLPPHVCSALIAGGFNLLYSPSSIFNSFVTAGVQAYQMTPKALVDFLKSNRLLMPELPAPLSSTPFHDIRTLLDIISYCLSMDDLMYNLDDLPFGLAQDGRLHYLSQDEQLFYSSEHHLVPECADLFLHSDLITSSFPDISIDNLQQIKVFKPFGVEELGLYINQTLEDEFCPSDSLLVSWNPGSTSRPNKSWLASVWSFLTEQTMHITRNYEHSPISATEHLESTLFALQSWTLFPVYAVPEGVGSSQSELLVGDQDELSDDGKEGSSLREISKKLSMSRSSAPSCNLEDRENFLVALQHSHMVMDFSQPHSMSEALRQTLRKLKLPELNHKLFDDKSNPKNKQSPPLQTNTCHLTRLLCAKITEPSSVLTCLSYCVDRSSQCVGELLNVGECNTILKYFSEAIEKGQIDATPQCLTQLRKLPFYISISGQQTELADCEVYILPSGIPGAEIDIWRSKAGVLFLQTYDSHMSLYSFLGCQSLTDIQVYCHFIFEHFEYLSEAARIVHLTYIRDRKLPMLSDEERETLIERLTSLKFIRSQLDGELHAVNEYYDSENKLFQLMLSKDMFPPQPFDSYRWTRFLQIIGLNSIVSEDKFVEFAQQIAESARNEELKENRLCLRSRVVSELEEKSKVLVQELFKTTNLASNDSLLGRIKSIPFICATRVNSKYYDICPQSGFVDKEVIFIPFADAICENKENIESCWSSAYFIPHWADPTNLKSSEVNFDYHDDDALSSLEVYKQEVARHLGIKPRPSKQEMVTHVKNISDCIAEESHMLAEEKLELLRHVMTTIYKYLQLYAMDDNFVAEELEDINCVLIDGKSVLIKASQLVLSLYDEQQIKPYLYKVPTSLSNFNSLFRYLGASERATPMQYSAVLNQLYVENHAEVLHPNSLRCAYRAVKGLFSLLSKADCSEANIDGLYLPGQDACLAPANYLVYNDEPSYTDRLVNVDLPFLVDLRECKLQISYFHEITRKLSEESCPQMLSELVEECLAERCVECHSSYGTAQILRSRLTSTEFTAGILRLIRHDHMERAEKPKATALKAIQKSLKNVRVHAVEELVTYLKYNGSKVEGSERNAQCFVTKSCDANDTTNWSLYVLQDGEITPELLVKVAEIVNKIAGGLLHNSIIYLHPILSCASYEIPVVLDNLRIRQDHHTAHGPTLQPPGSFIPIYMHHLLRQDFVRFEVDEYVGYELDDPEMYNQSGSATYIYAIVLEKLPVECAKYDRNTQQFFDRYRINVGDDTLPIIVSSLDLYRLHRVIEKKRSRQLSLNSFASDVYHDVSFTQTEAGDYLLLSPGSQSVMTELEPGVVTVEEEIDEEGEVLESADHCSDDINKENTTEDSEVQVVEESTTSPEEVEATDDALESGPELKKEAENAEPKPKDLPRDAEKKVPQDTTDSPSAAATANTHIDFPEISEKNLPELERLLNKQVRAIWKLPDDQRKKAIKRLMLKFHPDKNPEKNELCTKLTQHIRVIIEDIEGGGFVADKENRADWWSEFINRRAKAYGEQKTNFEEKLKETFAQYASTLGPEFASGYDAAASRQKFEQFKAPERRNPVPEEARRWLRQAKADMQSAYNDMGEETAAYEWVLLKVYQSAEKALKSACYTLDSKKVNLTDLKLISSSLRNRHVSEYAKQLQELIGSCDQLTHPSNVGFPKIPHELADAEKAAQALSLCEDLLEKIIGEFHEVMEKDLRGEDPDSPPPTDAVDNSMALVPFPVRSQFCANKADRLSIENTPSVALPTHDTDGQPLKVDDVISSDLATPEVDPAKLCSDTPKCSETNSESTEGN